MYIKARTVSEMANYRTKAILQEGIVLCYANT